MKLTQLRKQSYTNPKGEVVTFDSYVSYVRSTVDSSVKEKSDHIFLLKNQQMLRDGWDDMIGGIQQLSYKRPLNIFEKLLFVFKFAFYKVRRKLFGYFFNKSLR